MPDILFFDAITDAESAHVGGKGLSLGKTATAGLPVPPGFVVTTQAFRRLRERGIRADAGFTRALLDAYRTLGGGPVAVRSSATAEDAADTSFAGQQETILGVEGDDRLIEAVERCWRSLYTERAAAYRAKQGVDAAGLAMAVVVQQLVPAESAGVLFTRDPMDPDGKTMLAEASWGLGEAVVSGRVQPDRFKLDRETGRVIHDVEVFRKEDLDRVAAKNSHASPTPILASGRCYCHFGTYGTACIDVATGKQADK
jgi:pyruvate,water dikinase